MSLRGRYIIDRIKKSIGSTFRLPVPPYGEAEYWDAAYRSFGPHDSFEWGDLSLQQDFLEYTYRPLNWETGRSEATPVVTTLAKTIGIEPRGGNDDDDKNNVDEPILILGCGNSRMGEEMVEHAWGGPIIQVDISSRVVESMSQRCASWIENGHMNFVQDDATELSAFRNGMISACLDKGLMDALFCADDYTQCTSVMKSVHRVLRPGGVFLFWSFSRPEFLFPKIIGNTDYGKNISMWKDVQVQELSRILLYRFQKVEVHSTTISLSSRKMKQGGKRKG